MVIKNYYDVPPILRDFLSYHETVKSHSKRTVDEYYLDLRNFFRFIKLQKHKVQNDIPFDNISISDVDLALIRSITLSDIYDYLSYLSRDRPQHKNSEMTDYGLMASSRARKVACIRSFYKYLTNKAHLLEENPVAELDAPNIKKSLPRYLNLEESVNLLASVDGENETRDYCILTLFLNCGLRISELVGLNLSDIRDDQLRVLGKGNKERILYLNDACRQAIDAYLVERMAQTAIDKTAFFLSNRRTRISRSTVNWLVKKHLAAAGLDSTQYSAHKLRHTAATLMLQNGVDVRTLQEVLGHDHLNTTQIYTHVSSDDLRVAAKANPLGTVKQKKKKTEAEKT